MRTLVFHMLIFNLHILISKMNEDMNFIFISMQKSSYSNIDMLYFE